jgi:S-adenosylmethionine-diacylgycerolhomoserine-N-methlytransferase
MMPAWEAVLSRAYAMLKPGGLIGVVDFYVSESDPRAGLVRHGALTRHFWPWWFKHDGVRLSSDTLTMLRLRFEQRHLVEGMATVPWTPGLRVPYFQFVGRRP